MNAITFQLKRAHLAASKAGRWLIGVVPDMTPARFDIMILLRQAGLALGKKMKVPRRDRKQILENCCFMEQKRIVEELGLHKSTVSEALKRLEELGWVVRVRDYDDRRNWLVQMTRLGRLRTFEACKILFRRDVLRGAVDEFVRIIRPDRPFNVAFDDVWNTIRDLARFFGDTSTCGVYDRQVSYEVPEFREWERFTNRMFGTGAGPRLPDYVLEFLYHWEQARMRRCDRPCWD